MGTLADHAAGPDDTLARVPVDPRAASNTDLAATDPVWQNSLNGVDAEVGEVDRSTPSTVRVPADDRPTSVTSAQRDTGHGPVRTTNFHSMLSTLLVIVGVVVGLFVLLSLIVRLSAPPATRGRTTGSRTTPWVADSGQPHPDAWSPLSSTSTQTRTLR